MKNALLEKSASYFSFMIRGAHIRNQLVETSRTRCHMPGFDQVDDDVIIDFLTANPMDRKSIRRVKLS